MRIIEKMLYKAAMLASPPPRFDRLDALRGLAMLWMTVFHFCFDLNHFGWLKQNFYTDPVWTWQRALIVSMFLFCAGMGQAVATAQGQSWPRFWRRWAMVAGCALLVSAGSFFMYPKSFIYFGILHGIALMLIIVRLTAAWGQWLWLLGACAIALKFIAAYVLSTLTLPEFSSNISVLLHSKAFNWLGLIAVKPITEDYVPLVPWLGVMWWGMAAGQWVLAHRPAWFSAPVGRAEPLAILGRWSLSYYMVHQPVMIGALMLVKLAIV